MKVNYGGFFRKEQSAEIPLKRELNRSVVWYGMEWKIPAAYLCKEGIVLDLCRSVPKEVLEAYYKKWKPLLEKEEVDPGQEAQIKRENPFARDYTATLTVDGKIYERERLSSMAWYGLGKEEANSQEAEELMEAYSCDRCRAWQFDRISFPWPEGKAEEAEVLSVTLKALPVYYEGVPRFVTKPGCGCQQVQIQNPVGISCRIEIKGCEASVLKEEMCREGMEWPRQFQILTYEIQDWDGGEAVGDKAVRPVIRDCRMSNEPRKKAEGTSGGAIGVSVFAVKEKHGDSGEETVCSSLHFEPQDETEWMVLFPKVEASEKTIFLTGQE